MKIKSSEATYLSLDHLYFTTHSLRYPGKGDFIADEKYVFEIGGKKRSTIRIRGTLNSFRVMEDADFSSSDSIPLWLFGFLF